MGSSRSEAVRARQAALGKLLDQQRATLERTADLAVAVSVMAAERAQLRASLAEVEADFRAGVGQLVELGQSVEQIAMLTDLPVAVIRAARRPRREPERVAEVTPLSVSAEHAGGPGTSLSVVDGARV